MFYIYLIDQLQEVLVVTILLLHVRLQLCFPSYSTDNFITLCQSSSHGSQAYNTGNREPRKEMAYNYSML